MLAYRKYKKQEMKTAIADISEKTELLKVVYSRLSSGLQNPNATAPRKWLKGKALTIENSGAAYNSGQLHQGKEQAFKEALEAIGMLKRSGIGATSGEISYTCFGKISILFALRNENKEIVNFYAMSIEKDKNTYLNEDGIYPCFPDEKTSTLYITDTLLDAATLLESKVLKEGEAVMALHDGELKAQHKTAIENLNLKELIYLESKK